MFTKWYKWDVLQVSNNLCRSLAMLEEMGVNVWGQSSFMRVISKMQHFGANQSNPLNDRDSAGVPEQLEVSYNLILCVLSGGFMRTYMVAL